MKSNLLELVVGALKLADDLELHDIGITLDQARLQAVKACERDDEVSFAVRHRRPLAGSDLPRLRDYLALSQAALASAAGVGVSEIATIEETGEPVGTTLGLAVEALMLRQLVGDD